MIAWRLCLVSAVALNVGTAAAAELPSCGCEQIAGIQSELRNNIALRDAHAAKATELRARYPGATLATGADVDDYNAWEARQGSGSAAGSLGGKKTVAYAYVSLGDWLVRTREITYSRRARGWVTSPSCTEPALRWPTMKSRPTSSRSRCSRPSCGRSSPIPPGSRSTVAEGIAPRRGSSRSRHAASRAVGRSALGMEGRTKAIRRPVQLQRTLRSLGHKAHTRPGLHVLRRFGFQGGWYVVRPMRCRRQKQ